MQKDGATLRQHLEIIEQQSGKRPEQLEEAPMPDALRYLWQTFVELSNLRGSSGFGPSSLTPQQIESWCRLNFIQLMPFELEAIVELDGLYMEAQAKQSKKK